MENLINNPFRFIKEELANAKKRFNETATPMFFGIDHLNDTREDFLATYNELVGTIKTLYLFKHIDDDTAFKYLKMAEDWKGEYSWYLKQHELKYLNAPHPQVRQLEQLIADFKEECETNAEHLKDVVDVCNRSRNRIQGALIMLADSEIITTEELVKYYNTIDSCCDVLANEMKQCENKLREEVEF